jgi:hypothetical protein
LNATLDTCPQSDGGATTQSRPIDGTLTVTTFTPPCDHGACGRLDAALDIPASANASASAPSLTGRATLAYSETSIPCPSGGGIGPGLGAF